MEGNEIRKEIEELKIAIQEAITVASNTGILSTSVGYFLERIKAAKARCPHEYIEKDGKMCCKYCGDIKK